MKHWYMVMGICIGILSILAVTVVSADDKTVDQHSITGTGTTGSGMTHKKLEHQEDRLKLLDTTHSNRESTREANMLSSKEFIKANQELRNSTIAACKVIIAQVGSGTITREEGLTQCKELKSKMESTIKSMRQDLQDARQAAREATKATNQNLKKEFKEEHKSWSGTKGTGDMKPHHKDSMGTGKINSDKKRWSGTKWSGDMMKLKLEKQKEREKKSWTGAKVWSGKVIKMDDKWDKSLKDKIREQKEKEEYLKKKQKEKDGVKISDDSDHDHSDDKDDDHTSGSGSTNTWFVLPIA